MRIPFLLVCCLALAVAADYYVSPTGSDSANGTSTSTPWKTVGKVSGRNFAAGDRIFFQGGQTFTDSDLYFDSGDTGTAANPITVGSYGTGRATLQPPATKHAINIYNTAGLYIRDLILAGPGAAASDTNEKRGVQAYCDLAGGTKLTYLRLENLDISSFHEGITIGAWHSSFSGFTDVLITNCVIHDNLGNGMTSYGYQPGSASQQSHANLQVVGCEIMRNYGDPTLSNPSGQHSGSGIILSGMKGGLVDRCYVHHNGGGAGDNAGGGPVGIWTYASDGVVIQRSLVHDQRTTAGAVDGGGFDIDGGATNAVIQYCYSYSNDGPGFLVAEYTGATPLQNGTFRYNVSWRDGRRTSMNMASGFHFWSGENLTSECQDIRVYNNLVYSENATGGACVRYQSGPMAGIRFWNNIFVVQGGEIFVTVGANTGYFTIQNNLYWSTDNNWTGGWRWGGTTYTALSAWRAAIGTPETLSGTPVGLQADPLVNALVAGAQPTSVAQMEAMTTFQLLAASPAINAGADLRTATYGPLDIGTRDFWNSTLPVGGAFDLGPHERTWEVSYQANGATSGTVPAAQAKALSMNLNLAGNSGSLARTGYTFSGWNTAADGSGTTYAAGGTYSGNASEILYALWTPSAGNSAPTITTAKPASLTTAEDTAGTVSLAATDANGDALTWSIPTQGTKGVAAVSGTGSPKSVTYTPTANQNGSDSFIVQVSDGKGGTDTITVNVTITALNDVPVATAQSVTVTEDTAKAITLSGTDVEGSALTYAIGTGPSKGMLSGTAPNLTYTPNLNATGADSFTFTVNDGSATSAAVTVSITITAMNDAPVLASPIVDQAATVGMAFSFQVPVSTFTDVDSASLTWSSNEALGWLSFTASTRTFSGTPAAGDVASTTITVTASDGSLSASDSFVLTVSATANTPPIITTAKPASLTTLEDTAGAVSLAATDANGDTLTWSILTQGTKGTASVSGTGNPKSVAYTPNANLNGSDSLVVQVSDGKGGTDTIMVNVTITAVNDAPVSLTAPTTSGKSTVGREQAASSGTWSDSDGTVVGYAYQWQRALGAGAYADIVGATATTYTPVAGDAGYNLRVRVTASDNGTPGTTSTAAFSAATLVKGKTATPTVTTSTTLATATPTISGTSTAGATIWVYDGSVLIGTVTADGAGGWSWTPATPLPAGTHSLTVTAELAPEGESGAVGPITVTVTTGVSSGVVVGGSGGGGGGCGAGGLLGLFGIVLLPWLRRGRSRR